MSLGRMLSSVVAAVILGALGFALWPKSVRVDVAAATRNDMAVTVDEDGRTRVRERYVVSSPLAAELMRVELDPGDAVTAGKTVLAVLQPNESALLDPRTAREAEAKVSAAESVLAQSAPNIARATAALEMARLEHQRLTAMAKSQVVARQELDRAAYTERMRDAELEAARFQEQIARFELDMAKAALDRTGVDGARSDATLLRITAPASGRVLKVLHESGAAVAAGTPIMEVGDPTDIEVEVDVLSSDAVRIPEHAPASLEHWGGDDPLHAVVRLVEPSGFLKVSALGVEEQRVYVVMNLVDPVEHRPSLGDGYRVDARIVVWEGRDVLTVPIGALVRHGDGWAAFAVEDGIAKLRALKIGHQNQASAEVLEGLREGERVIVHAPDLVADGVRVVERS